MPIVLQVSLVIVNAALVVLIIRAIVTMNRLDKTADNVNSAIETLEVFLTDATRTSTEVRELVASLERVSDGTRGIVARFEAVSDRAAAVSSVVLDQVEPPLRRAAAVVVGLKAGAGVLVGKWASRQQAVKRNGGQ
jgi:uncharacterized protein YoxC